VQYNALTPANFVVGALTSSSGFHQVQHKIQAGELCTVVVLPEPRHKLNYCSLCQIFIFEKLFNICAKILIKSNFNLSKFEPKDPQILSTKTEIVCTDKTFP
jgi:hypothetical protein